MKEKVTPFIRSLSENPFIRKQYFIDGQEPSGDIYNDPLMEDKHEMVKGLVHKYSNRALIKVSYQCAAHCRFCTRIRQIGNPIGRLNPIDIKNIVRYLSDHTEIDDVILSGGDPFYTPSVTLELLEELQDLRSVKTIRIGTRMPFHSPVSFQAKPVLELLERIGEIARQQPFFILIHIEHPDELTPETIAVLKQLKQLPLTLLSQTVFLKEINDDFETLHTLFRRLYHLGVLPYYLYHCDKVKGLEHFEGDIEKEKQIAVRLRQELSGLACPLFVEDIEDGYGKIPV